MMQKNRMAALLLSGIMTLTAVPLLLPEAAIRAKAKDDAMPAPFAEEADRAYSKPCEPEFDNIPEELLALVPEEEVTAWRNFNESIRTETAGTLMEYPNTYSFIKVFELEPDAVREAMAPAFEAKTAPFTESELTLILTASETDLLTYFMTDYPIVAGDRFYTPQWLYEHTAEEYAEAGIKPEQIAEKLAIYPDFPFTLEASIAFSDKLYSYVGSAAGLIKWGFVPGDMTLDGAVNVLDIVMLQRYLLKVQNITYAQWAAADRDGDNYVDVTDLALIKRDVLAKMPRTVMLEDVIEYNQHPDYPTGCESVALYILLQYYHTDVTVEQIVDALPKGNLPHTENGRTVGPDPEKKFVGDPRNSSSFGVFNGPIALVAEQFRSGVQTRTGASLEDVTALLDAGIPVLVWYTTNPDRGIVYRRSWYDEDTGNLIRWPGGEHAVVVCGHVGTESITYRDPDTGGTNTLPLEKFRETFDELGGRIIWYPEG